MKKLCILMLTLMLLCFPAFGEEDELHIVTIKNSNGCDIEYQGFLNHSYGEWSLELVQTPDKKFHDYYDNLHLIDEDLSYILANHRTHGWMVFTNKSDVLLYLQDQVDCSGGETSVARNPGPHGDDERFRAIDIVSDANYLGIVFTDSNGKYGVIDPWDNEIVIPAEYDYLYTFGNYHFYAVDENGEKLTILDRDANAVSVNARLSDFGEYDSYCGEHLNLNNRSGDGLIAAIDCETGLSGYVDIEGNWAVAPQYATAEPFENGLAYIRNADDNLGLIDTSGNAVIPAEYDMLTIDRRIIARRRDSGTMDVFTLSGEILFSCDGYIQEYGPGFYAASKKQLLDANGEPVEVSGTESGSPLFSWLEDPDSIWPTEIFVGHLMCRRNSENGQIYVINREYRHVDRGYSHIEYGCTTDEGMELFVAAQVDAEAVAAAPVDCGDDDACSAERSWKPARSGQKFGLIDIDGNEIIPCSLDDLKPIEGTQCFYFSKDRYFGIIDCNAKPVFLMSTQGGWY